MKQYIAYTVTIEITVVEKINQTKFPTTTDITKKSKVHINSAHRKLLLQAMTSPN